MPAKRGFAQPLIVLILFGLLAAVIFNFQKISTFFIPLNPPPPPYVSTIPQWKVYKNSTYKFALQYPNTWYARTYGDYAANFQVTDPTLGEATPGAIRVKFSALTEKADENEFLQIAKTDPSVPIYEPLDVLSVIEKVKNFTVGKNSGVEYIVHRHFSAPEGPRGEFTHAYSVHAPGVVLHFFSVASTKEEEATYDILFQKMIKTLTVN